MCHLYLVLCIALFHADAAWPHKGLGKDLRWPSAFGMFAIAGFDDKRDRAEGGSADTGRASCVIDYLLGYD